MKSDYSKHGNVYQIFLVIGLFLSSSYSGLFIITSIYHAFNISQSERYLDVKKTEEGVDPAYIDQLERSVEREKIALKQCLIKIAVGIVFLSGFIILEIRFIKAKNESYKQELSASDRIKQAQKNQSTEENI